jgi:hypothetical protein
LARVRRERNRREQARGNGARPPTQAFCGKRETSALEINHDDCIAKRKSSGLFQQVLSDLGKKHGSSEYEESMKEYERY